MALNVIKNYLKANDCYKSGQKITPIGIQIHTVGTAQSSAAALSSYWNQPGTGACTHYAADARVQGQVLQFLPENYRSWADAGYGNDNLITIEGMESNHMRYTGGANYVMTDRDEFIADITRSYNGMVELCAKICRERGWNPTTKLPGGLYLISSHDEGRVAGISSMHVDPTHIWSEIGFTMDGFRIDVAEALSDIYEVGKRYKALSSLTIRKAPAGTALPYKEIPLLRRWTYLKGVNGQARIKKGTTVRCREIVRTAKGIYIKVTRGYILVQHRGRDRVQKV